MMIQSPQYHCLELMAIPLIRIQVFLDQQIFAPCSMCGIALKILFRHGTSYGFSLLSDTSALVLELLVVRKAKEAIFVCVMEGRCRQ